MPASLLAMLAGSRWLRNQVGEAGAEVFRVLCPDGQVFYLKHGRGNAAVAVLEEMARLNWLSHQDTSVQCVLPKLVHFECGPGEA